jgi:hypothetical protein
VGSRATLFRGRCRPPRSVLTLACSNKDGDAECTDVFYADADGDGHGDPQSTTTACDAPDGFTTADDDCDDTKGTVFPGAEEICDGIDNDCDLTTDVGASDARNWYPDSDHDGFGAGDPTVACTAPDGYAGRPNDCDTVAEVNPDAPRRDGSTTTAQVVDDEDDDVVPTTGSSTPTATATAILRQK